MKPKDSSQTDDEKPFPCTWEGCKRRYRNINGLKYHIRSTHKKPAVVANGAAAPPEYDTCANLGRVRAEALQCVLFSVRNRTPKQEHRCHCGRVYKTPHGLRQHKLTHDKPAIQPITSPGVAQPSTQQSLKGKVAAFVRQKANSSNGGAAQSNSGVKTESIDLTNTIDAVAAGELGPDVEPVNPTPPPPTASPSPQLAAALDGNKPDVEAKPVGELAKPVQTPTMIAAPTLQRHLLSPVVSVAKATVNVNSTV